MADPVHFAKLAEGVEAWNRWRRENPHVNVDLRDAKLSERDLDKVDFSRAELWGATLSGAYLKQAKLGDAGLYRADLRDADLSGACLAKARMSETFLRAARFIGTDLREADLRNADLTEADFSGADLRAANLSGATLVNTQMARAKLSGCAVFGISAWNVQLEDAEQTNLTITPHGESPIQVDNLEVAQFIYLLLHNEKIRGVIDTVGKKAVLILGRFTSERKAVLDAIRDALRGKGYLPILFDFEKPGTRDTHETIVTLAGMARFIVADITDAKSIPQELGSIVPNMPSVPVQPLLQAGFEPWAMFDHIRRYPWVLPLLRYDSEAALMAVLEGSIIRPAEGRARAQAPI
jgi:Pentapeptide repeats (8 copies)